MAPTRGHFVLYNSVTPALPAGGHLLQVNTNITAGGATETSQSNIEVTAPRFRMPPNQILSTFPPANDVGSFENRLPQIVLKERTVPWARQVDTDDDSVPWLALVVIAEGEGELSGETAVADCVTEGVKLSGRNDVATGLYLGVTQTVVNKVFPTKQDLELLAHVREVDLADTELALGDDDGFLAVIMANRLPQFDRVTNEPVRYLAALISLEGQVDVLPPPTPRTLVANTYNSLAFVQDLAAFVTGGQRASSRTRAPGSVNTTGPSVTDPSTAASHNPSVRNRATAVRAVGATSRSRFEGGAKGAPTAAELDEELRLQRDFFRGRFRIPVTVAPEKTYRFPVLAHWSFTCTGAGSFETLMQNLDVGLLGTAPVPPEDLPGGRELETTETGHVGLDHLTRRGDSTRAWYRSPLSPLRTVRERPESGRLPLAHTSDQLRAVTPDGRENLSRSAAFEIGRLLALSNPAVVSALQRWRREQFGRARLNRFADFGIDPFFSAGELSGARDRIDQITGSVLDNFARDPERWVGLRRPLVDPGPVLDVVPEDPKELADLLNQGLALPGEALQSAELQDVVTKLASVADGTEVLRSSADLGQLRAALVDEIRSVVGSIAIGQQVAGKADIDNPFLKGVIDNGIDLDDIFDRPGPVGGGLNFEPGDFDLGATIGGINLDDIIIGDITFKPPFRLPDIGGSIGRLRRS